MKKSKLFLAIIFIAYSTILLAQENGIKAVIKSIQEDALLREKVFIHTNKTTYLSNENIWFSAYVTEDSNNTPSLSTSNLLVNLLNDKGAILESKTLFIKNGVGSGDFLIKDVYPDGTYFIQSYTNFMKNFGQENVFLQEIQIINPSIKNETAKATSENKYDLQVFPESGYLLEETNNRIGIKVLINGKGYAFKGRIVDENGTEISSFIGNKFGMSKSEFFYKANQTYTAIININDTEQKIKLPNANKKGVVFSIDTTNDKVKLTLKTNKKSLPELLNQPLAILFYRNNFISEAVTLTINKLEETSQELFFDKSKMLEGVNVVTLFKNNQPIAERKFFIDKSESQTAILIEKINTLNDSIGFKIKTVSSDYSQVPAHLSISVLPLESKSLNEKQNIKSAFLLSPYVNGTIENPSYYFNNSDPTIRLSLDLLLLNQGWSQYSLEEKIEEINPKKQYGFESGFTINGTFKKPLKGYDATVISKKNRLTALSEINQNKEFAFENIFAYKNDSIKIAFIKKDKPLVKPSKINLNQSIENTSNYSYLTSSYIKKPIIKNNQEPSENNPLTQVKRSYPSTELLDVVQLKKITKKKKETIYDLEANIAVKRKTLAPSFYESKKVTKEMEVASGNLFGYFQSRGFIKRTNENGYFISLRQMTTTLFGLGMNPDHTYPPKLYLDNVALPNGDIESLKDIRMFDVDEVLINRAGAGAGIDGMGGIIKIYLKKGNHTYYEESPKNLYESLVLLTGFDRAKEYYTPLYNIYNKDSYNWTEIDWKNSIITDDNGEAIFKVPTNKFSNEFQFIINGLSKNGLLFNIIYKTENEDF